MFRARAGIAFVTALIALGSGAAAGQTAVTSLRAVAASPDRYANRPVTVTGRFRGRAAPDPGLTTVPPLNRSRWDFLLNEAEAAVWVSGIRPSGWDFDLDPRSPADARRGAWLQVTGTVRVARSARRCAEGEPCQDVWIEASDLRAARAPSPVGFQLPIRPAVQAPRVVFNDPLSDETEVAPSTSVRLQFSRSMMADTLSERIRISYTAVRGMEEPPIPRFTAIYVEATRSLAVTFATPLAPAQTVKVELLDGIVAANGRPLEAWSFVFSTAR